MEVQKAISWHTKIDQMARRYLGRPVAHLTLPYVFDRSRVWMYQCRHPNSPWLTADAVSILDSVLRASNNGLEYGCGRSMVWFAQRTNSLISMETSHPWYDRVSETLRSRGLRNVHLKYIPADHRIPDDPYHALSIEADDEIALESLDYALIDGLYRDECALRAFDLLKPGGLLILDNANWFIPHTTCSPFSVTVPASRLWSKFLSRVVTCRLIWTSNGAWDTALWFKVL